MSPKKQVLKYQDARLPTSVGSWAGHASIILLALEIPWYTAIGLGAWLYVFGDPTPKRAQEILLDVFLALPLPFAAALGLTGIFRSKAIVGRLYGYVGLIGATVWLVFIFLG